VPEPLRVVVQAQLRDGRWPVGDAALEHVLGSGHGLPHPPPGLVDWKWATALCLAFLRRYPDNLDFSGDAYERGLFHVGDPATLDAAKQQLPPCDLPAWVKLDESLVAQGRWSDAVQQVLHEQGYQAFLPPPEDRPHEPDGEEDPHQAARAQLAQEQDARYGEQQSDPLPPRANGDGGHKKRSNVDEGRVADDDEEVAERLEDERRQIELDARRMASTLWKANTLRGMGVARLRVANSVGFRNGRDTAILRAAKPLEQSLPLFQNVADRLARENAVSMDAVFPALDLCSSVTTAESLDAELRELCARGGDDECGSCQTTPRRRSTTQTKNPMEEIKDETQEILQGLLERSAQSKLAFIDDIYVHEQKLERELDILVKRERLGVPGAVDVLSRRWTKATSVRGEAGRLERVTRPSPRPEWDLRPNRDHSARAQRERTGRKPQPRQVSTLENESIHAAALQSETSPTPTRGGEKSLVAERESLENEIRRERLRDNVDRRLSVLVKRISHYDALVRRAKEELARGSRLYREAATRIDRNKAFGQLTSVLSDLRLAVCSVVEGVSAWREAGAELAKAEEDPEELNEDKRTAATRAARIKPFFWNGSNVLLALLDRLDFLAGSSQLCQWYGSELPLLRNPFLVAVQMHERPVTPCSAVRRVLVDGKQVMRVSAKLAERREREVKLLDAAWSRVSSGPKWWPMCSKPLWLRVRSAEKVLLAELDRHDAYRSVLGLPATAAPRKSSKDDGAAREIDDGAQQ